MLKEVWVGVRALSAVAPASFRGELDWTGQISCGQSGNKGQFPRVLSTENALSTQAINVSFIYQV